MGETIFSIEPEMLDSLYFKFKFIEFIFLVTLDFF